jgi:hypothetical protein
MSLARDIADLGSSATSLDKVGSNLLINGAHTVDQRNSGSSANVTNGADHFIADRFRFSENSSATFSAQQVSDAPVGFEKSSKITVTGTDSSLAATEFHRILQPIEGSNISHLNWGSSNAKTLTLTFHVKSSLTGQFYVFAFNSAANRTFLSGYTIDSANTWEKKSIQISGDQSGTWLTTTGVGIYLGWSLGTGSTYQSSTLDAFQAGFFMAKSDQVNFGATNSATWQLTGCQLEVGSVTDFEHEPYSVTLAKAQRYFYSWTSSGLTDNLYIRSPYASGTPPNTSASVAYTFPVTMRANPTMAALTGSAVSNLNRMTSSIHNATAQHASTSSNAALSLDTWTADAEL